MWVIDASDDSSGDVMLGVCVDMSADVKIIAVATVAIALEFALPVPWEKPTLFS